MIARGWASAQPSDAVVGGQHRIERALRQPCDGALACFSRWRPTSRAHIIGVVVSETTSDTRMATESVTANSRNSRPTMPPMSRIGMKTATSDRLMESNREADLARAQRAPPGSATCPPRYGA